GRAGFDRGLDTGRELIGRSHLTNFETLAAGLSGIHQLRQCHGSERITRGYDHGDNPNAGAELVQDLQPLAADFGSLGGETGNICAGPVQALDDTCSDWVAGAGENDGYGWGGGLRRLGSLRAEARYDHIRICCRGFSGQLRQAPHLSFGGAIVEDQILAFAIAKLIKPLFHNHRVLTAHESEVSYAVSLSRLLRAQRQRPCHRCAAKKRDELPAPHGLYLKPRSTSYHILPRELLCITANSAADVAGGSITTGAGQQRVRPCPLCPESGL